MRICYKHSGPTKRTIEGYEWSKQTGYVQEISSDEANGRELIRNLLTYPDSSFIVAGDDPLGQLVGAARAAELAIYADVYTPEDYERWQNAQSAARRRATLFVEVPDDDESAQGESA